MLRKLCDRLNSLGRPYMQQSIALSSSPIRFTVIVKRVYKPPLVQIPDRTPLETPQGMVDKSVINTDDDKWMIYNVEEKFQPHHKVKVILLRNVDDFGVKGQIVYCLFHEAHSKLLLPGFAVYHTEENVKRLGDFIIPEEQIVNSSESARLFLNYFSKRIFDICMSSSTPWTIEKWHIKASMRKHKVWLSDDQIEIPGGQISGPDTNLENKEFIAIITINNHEKVKIRCHIHHIVEDEYRVEKVSHWWLRFAEPVWEHERSELMDMNRAPPNKKQREDKSLAEEIEKWKQWKREREERLANY